MSKWLFDIECDGLLKDATITWIIVAYNFNTKETKHWLWDDVGWKYEFNKATHLIGHNICNYDLPVLEKIHGFIPPKSCRIQDTLLLSQILDYKRFGNEGHSMEVWGNHLGFPKIPFDDFSQYSENMKIYCHNDVRLNTLIYEVLMSEYRECVKKNPKLSHYVLAEHAAARWCAKAALHGWPFDKEKAYSLFDLFETEMENTEKVLSEKLGYKVVPIDKKKGIIETKKPRWTKAGCYDQHTANYFEIDPYSGYEGEERPVAGEYTRISIEPLKLGSSDDVKKFLFRHGWEPTDWNYKSVEVEGKKRPVKIKTSPKITEDSLEFLGGDGKLYTEYTSTKSRHSILKTWLENLDENDNLHGDIMLIGTPSMRARHSIIVNVPSTDKPWGKEMRELFICKPGWKIIGCDSAGNQARGLAHYLGDQEYIDTLLHGDIHQYNANKLTDVLYSMSVNHEVKRSQAKRIFYAFLFGASGTKLWSYVFGTPNGEDGAKFKNGFLKSVPGFESLIDKLERVYASTKKFGDGYIYGLAGNKLYVDSFHKLLVYLLQAAEKATCSAALMLCAERLEDEGIPYIPLIYYHDEIDFMVPEQYAERAAAIGKQAFIDGPKLFGVNIMDGDAKIGDSWYEVH